MEDAKLLFSVNERNVVRDKHNSVQERTPSLSTNQRVLYPRATFVYLLRYPFSVGGPDTWLSFISVVSLFATAMDEYTENKNKGLYSHCRKNTRILSSLPATSCTGRPLRSRMNTSAPARMANSISRRSFRLVASWSRVVPEESSRQDRSINLTRG